VVVWNECFDLNSQVHARPTTYKDITTKKSSGKRIAIDVDVIPSNHVEDTQTSNNKIQKIANIKIEATDSCLHFRVS